MSHISSFEVRKLFELHAPVSYFPPESTWKKMHESDAFGVDVFYDDSGEKPFGLGWIKFPPFGEVKLHTHKGSHMLVCFAGNGKVCVEIEENGVKKIREELLLSGYCYSIPSMIPHSVHAGAETLLLLVIGNDYRPADSHDRLDLIK